MEAEQIPGLDKSGKRMFVLRTEQEAFRENQGLWMLDGLTCYPTGNSEYPYWISKYSSDLKEAVWVLIHRDYGFQVLNQAGGRNDMYPGFGQSGAWRFSPYMIKYMAIERQDWEHLINQPMRGVVWISGLDYPTQFRDQLEAYEEEREGQEMYFYPGVFFGGSRGENSKIAMLPWGEPPAGYTAEGWRKEWVDALAAAFHLNVTHLEVRLGEGAMTQSDIASSIEAETAVAAMRSQIEMVWNYMAPPRVLVQVIWKTDRTRRYQIDSADKLSQAIARLNGMNQAPNQMVPGNPVFSREEIRALLEGYIGIEIPETETYDDIEPDSKTGEDVEETYWPMYNGRALTDLELDANLESIYKVGNYVMFLDSGEMGTILHWSGNNDWVWVHTENKYTMLVPGSRLCLMIKQDPGELVNPDVFAGDPIDGIHYAYDIEGSTIVWHGTFKVGDRAKTAEGTPVTIVGFAGTMALIKFDWDGPHIDPRQMDANTLRPFGVEVDGDPLPRVEEVDLDADGAESEARDTWQDIAPEDKKDLLDAEDEPGDD